MPQPKTAIFILGMHRSGTSLVTAAIKSLGANLGEQLLLSTIDNPKGYFEDEEVVALNMRLLEHYHISWDTILYHAPPELFAHPTYFDSAVESILKRLSENDDTFAIKDPRMALLLPIWLKKCGEMSIQIKYVFTFRHPAAVAQSLISRDAMSLQHAIVFWVTNTFQNLTYLDAHNSIFVEYDELLTSPDVVLNSLHSFLAISSIESTSSEIEHFKHNILDPALKRSVFHHLNGAQICEQIALKLYNELQVSTKKGYVSETNIASLKQRYDALAGLTEEIHTLEQSTKRLLKLLAQIEETQNFKTGSLANEIRMNDASWSVRAIKAAENLLIHVNSSLKQQDHRNSRFYRLKRLFK